jgi:hypothetical protein
VSYRTEAEGCNPFPPEETEDCWKKFMIGILTRTAENCLWLARQRKPEGVIFHAMHRHRTAYAEKVYGSAISWRWAMDGHPSEIPLEEVCEWVGVTPGRVRSGIVAVCRPYGDINKLADQAIARLHERLSITNNRTRSEPIDWAPLTKAKSEGLILCHPTRRRKSVSTRSRRRTYST